MTQHFPNPVLSHWNALDSQQASYEVLPCCGSHSWARELAAGRPFASARELYETSDRVWRSLQSEDWQQAFDSHPRIGERHARAATDKSLTWSAAEQKAMTAAESEPEGTAKLALVEGNRQYEERFGHIFIVCATGRSAAEILSILRTRLENTPAAEWLEAGEQQRQITQLRLRRWLGAE